MAIRFHTLTLTALAAATLVACGGGDALNSKPTYLGTISEKAYDGSTDDLLTAGLGATGLQAAVADPLRLEAGCICLGPVAVNSYVASVLADFIRHRLLAAGASFTFETVMSSPDKVAFLHKAQQAGFKTYLYYVATEDPAINIARVQHRVATGGHPVPDDKVISRYGRSLELLSDAVSFTSRAYIFDNSGHEQVWIAEVTQGVELELKANVMPYWVKTALWDKFSAD